MSSLKRFADGETMADVDRDKKRCKLASSKIVTLSTGVDSAGYQVHADVLRAVSRRFRHQSDSAPYLKDEILEAPALRPEVLDFFVRWAYRNCDMNMGCDKAFEKPSLPLLIDIFAFAEKCGVVRLGNHVLEEIWAKTETAETETGLEIKRFEHVYSCTYPSSRLRKLFITRAISRWDRTWLSKEEGRMWIKQNPEIAADLLAGYTRFIDKKHSGEVLALNVNASHFQQAEE